MKYNTYKYELNKKVCNKVKMVKNYQCIKNIILNIFYLHFHNFLRQNYLYNQKYHYIFVRAVYTDDFYIGIAQEYTESLNKYQAHQNHLHNHPKIDIIYLKNITK